MLRRVVEGVHIALQRFAQSVDDGEQRGLDDVPSFRIDSLDNVLILENREFAQHPFLLPTERPRPATIMTNVMGSIQRLGIVDDKGS